MPVTACGCLRAGWSVCQGSDSAPFGVPRPLSPALASRQPSHITASLQPYAVRSILPAGAVPPRAVECPLNRTWTLPRLCRSSRIDSCNAFSR